MGCRQWGRAGSRQKQGVEMKMPIGGQCGKFPFDCFHSFSKVRSKL